MPPKKDKVEKNTPEACTALVLQYLRDQNRPYSAIDVSANLHNKVTKAQAAKSLKELSEANQIASKASGKQVIYHALQDANDGLTPQQLSDLDQEVEELRNNVSGLKSEEKSIKSELATLRNIVTLNALKTESISLAHQKADLETRLTNLKSGAIQAVSAADRMEIDRAWKLWSYKVKARKKAFDELWNVLCENLPENKPKDDLWDELGLQAPDCA